jgi:divalent metal cation (Fe/Co/Zn/Cd) transporter
MERAAAIRRGRQLEYATISYNAIEALVALAAGAAASSIALIGFGIDSLIEMSSGLIMLWRLDAGDHAEERARKYIGWTFFALAGYVGVEAVETLLTRDAPERSIPGVALAFLSVMIMPWIARAKRRVGYHLNSGAMVADSRQTQLCAYLSFILLMGVGLNAAFGWWWADPVSALAMTPIIFKEGWDAVRGKGCGCATPLS